MRNTLLGPVHGEVIAASPYGSWQTVTPRAAAFTVPAEGETDTVFQVHPPAGTPAGVYWVLLKAVAQGHIAYGPAVAVHVRAPRTEPARPAPQAVPEPAPVPNPPHEEPTP
ncbi:hypothetical protein [Streptomyces boluensis]|uniref:Uncharacterized protein n=1 Tax=Streptomyces boluensis TaxID=1775135 RepID=A0A964V3Z3_9ACTN|nr:hypothetical protein [Streptomyces boluensis]NBE56940.1 hypothetical protein [Streptomyces boluensis]